MWQFWYSSGPFYSDSLPFRELTGKVYEGVALTLTVHEHNIRQAVRSCLGHKPKAVEVSSRNWGFIAGWRLRLTPAYDSNCADGWVIFYLRSVAQCSTQGLDSLSGSGCSPASISSISPTRWALCSCKSASNCLPPPQKLAYELSPSAIMP